MTRKPTIAIYRARNGIFVLRISRNGLSRWEARQARREHRKRMLIWIVDRDWAYYPALAVLRAGRWVRSRTRRGDRGYV